MALHVDLIENRWSGGFQERVGTVYVSDGQVDVKSDNPHYREIVLEGMPDAPKTSAAELLDDLPRRFHSDYFFASAPHDDDECPFARGSHVRIQQSPIAQPTSHAHA